MKRLLVLAFAVLCGATTAVHAQVSSLPDGSTLAFNTNYLYLHEDNSEQPKLPIMLPNSLWTYFNYAHCECGRPGQATVSPFYENSFAYLIQLQGQVSPQHYPASIWVGTDCDDTVITNRDTYCHQLTAASDQISDISTIVPTNGVSPPVGVYDVMEPEPAQQGQACQQRTLASNEWIAVSTTGADTGYYWVNQEVDSDSQAPPTPTSFTAAPSDNGVLLTWQAPVGNVADIAYYQALCVDGSGNGPSNPISPARYMTPYTLCGAPTDLATPAVPCTFTSTDSCTAPPTTNTTTDAGIDAAVADASDELIVRPQTPPATPDAGSVDAGTDLSPDASPPINLTALEHLDSKYICGQSTSATATSLPITGLTNGVPYTVMLLAIDKSGNASGVYFNHVLVPKPVVDWWQDMHNKGSQVEGGLCLLAETYGDDNPLTNTLRRFRDNTLASTFYGRWLTTAYYATLGKLGAVVRLHWTLRILSAIVLLPLVVFALLWHLLTLPGVIALALLLALRRRIVRSKLAVRAIATGALFVVALSAPRTASAQSPYWENQTTGSDYDASTPLVDVPPKWMAGFKIGPYTPAIDSMSGVQRNEAGQGPYQAMFGGYAIMPTIEVDRFLWSDFGQLGVGLSVSYMRKLAHPYVVPTPANGIDPLSPDRPRSDGDTTGFHMIPIQATAIYRFSYLDDAYGVPIVPYVRAGLGYYVWFATLDGNLSNLSDANDKAYGASVGLVGAAGIAIRAERIDADAARAMRDAGIDHISFYGEINAGWVDSFGQSSKLDVGGTTWFAGINFEF